MPSANMTCKEHGFCQHTSMWVCDQCAPKISGTQSTDVQQLKAEIAALATEIESCLGRIPSGDKVFSLIAKMRQLSAV